MLSSKGYEENYYTFKANGTCTVGYPCYISANDSVTNCANSTAPIGVIVAVRNGLCTVQLSGAVKLSYTGTTAPTCGYCQLAANGSGGVKVDTTNGVTMLVTSVASGKCEVIL